MTETRFAMTSLTPPGTRRIRASTTLHFTNPRFGPRNGITVRTLCLPEGVAGPGLRAKSAHKPRTFARQSRQKKCHTVQSNFICKSLKTNDRHPKEVTHKSGPHCTGISAVSRRRRREFSTSDFPISLFRLPETDRRFLPVSHYCAPRPAPHAFRRICALRCYKEGEEIPL